MSTAIFYCLYSVFVFYQQLHAANFRGESQSFGLFLGVFGLLFTVGQYIFLLFYGLKISWPGAIGMFALSFLFKQAWFWIEAKLGLRSAAFLISLSGFIALPICAYFLYSAF
jgi:hypothetical protein